MTLQTSTQQNRHLAAVPDLAAVAKSAQADSREIVRLAVAIATGTPVSAPIPADVLDRLAELDADAATADDISALAMADVEAARKELSEAARRLAEAEERWARAGIVALEASRACADARHSYGVALTATGYVRQP
jgi:hypothetical protein